MKVYQDELNEAKVNRDKLNELSEENDQNLNWKKKNADNILQESLKMVPDTENRLKSAEDDLSNMIVSNVYTCIYEYIIKNNNNKQNNPINGVEEEIRVCKDLLNN